MATATFLHYRGSNYLRQRLSLGVLSSKPVKITDIRSDEDDPGLREYEASYIRLLDRLTNGSTIEINETGTTLIFIPGMISGGRVEHECSNQRGIGYYLEGIIALAPFAKHPFQLTLRGITNSRDDPSVDIVKATSLPLLKRFITEENLQIKVRRRGALPAGGGDVLFTCPIVRQVRPIQFIDPGKIKRIRGTAFTMRMAPAIANRVVDAARGILNKLLPDVYIYTDHFKGDEAGKSPGFGLSLVAESTTGVVLAVESMSAERTDSGELTLPEDLGEQTAKMLLEEIWKGGCVDSRNQSLAFLLMALGQKDLSKIQSGELTSYTVAFLRHLRDFYGVVFRIEPIRAQDNDDEDEETLELGKRYIMSCVGAGYSNLSKITT
ncbi:RNA 3'-terminal phosphate cyclase-like protein [Oscarella lobularis]|uniref:RNA 3'-terminal phosphate cyclase-like protein n=1 Tax=Oscarella lobularis TaxID=121494 RepID=UPI003313CBE2